MSNIDEEIDCLNLKSIVNVNIVKIIVKTTTCFQLSWIKILNDIIIQNVDIFESLTKSINKSWLQWLAKTIKLSSKFNYILTRWKRLYNLKHTKKIIWLKLSKTHNDVMNIYIWYHFLIEITFDEDARRWDLQIWALLWNFEARLIANVWNSIKKCFIIFFNYNSRRIETMKTTIRNMMISLSNEWIKLMSLKSEKNIMKYARSKHYVRLWKEKNDKLIFLHKFDYIKIYKTLMQQRIEDVNFFVRVKEFIDAFHRVIDERLISDRLWQTIKTRFDIFKVENLLWRLLHQKIKIEMNWKWLKKSQRFCLIHDVFFTLQHIWVKCSVTKIVWQKMKKIWKYFDTFKFVQSNTVSELIVFMTICFIITESTVKRWNIIYQTTMWAIWKIYLFHFFALSHVYWNVEVAVAYYRKLFKIRILSDRILCMKEIHKNKEYNAKKFKKLWNQFSKQIRIVIDSRCLFKFIMIAQKTVNLMNIDNQTFISKLENVENLMNIDV